jgi:hypothetical protein
MDQMPIMGKTISGRILAHRRHGDSVPETDAPDSQWAQQVDLGHFPVVISASPTRALLHPRGLIIRSICFGLYFHRIVYRLVLVFRESC